MSQNSYVRPTDARRDNYREHGWGDQFIVPVLDELITGAITRFGTPLRPGAKALDAGCGGQPFRGMIEGRGFVYVGLDVVQNAAGTVEVLGVLDASELPQVDRHAPYELILCTEVLEHVAHQEQAFANFSRWLAPGGRLILTAPFFWPLHEVPYDFWRPTLYALRTFGQRFGLRELESQQGGDARMVVATALAHLKFTERRPTAYYVLWRKLFSFGCRTLVRFVRSRWLDRVVEVKSPLYLSSYMVLEKQQCQRKAVGFSAQELGPTGLESERRGMQRITLTPEGGSEGFHNAVGGDLVICGTRVRVMRKIEDGALNDE